MSIYVGKRIRITKRMHDGSTEGPFEGECAAVGFDPGDTDGEGQGWSFLLTQSDGTIGTVWLGAWMPAGHDPSKIEIIEPPRPVSEPSR